MPDILIIPQRGTTNNPVIQFTGSAANTIRMEVLQSGSVAYLGKSGSLFSVTDSLQGSLMAVSDISGLPILEVFSDDRVVMGKFNSNALVVTGSNVGVGKIPTNATLDISGSVIVSGSMSVTSTANPLQFKVSTTAAGGYSQIYLSNPTRDFILTNNAGDGLLSFNYGGANRLQFDTTNQWFNSGNLGIGTTSPTSYKLQVQGDIYANGGWFRVSGTQGYYFESYGGGWYMNDSTWIRAYNDKAIITSNEIRGTSFVDTANTAYYVDPASGTNLNGTLVNNGGTAMSAGWNRNLLLSSTFPVIVFNSNNTKYSGIGVDYSSAAAGMYFWVNGSSADISGTGTIALGINTGNYVTAYGSSRAPIFYDSDDTNYYVDPANGGFSLRGGSGNRVTYTTTDSGIYVYNAEGSGTTVRLGAAWNYPGIYNTTYLTLGAESYIEFRIGNSQKGYIDSSSNLFAFGSMRSPIFYDYNDTTYYVDPNNTTSASSNLRGRIHISGGHNYSSLRVFLPSAENGASTGTVALQMWCSEPGNTWDGAGFGYNVDNTENNGGSAPAYFFGRINTSLGQCYMRFLSGGDWYLYNTTSAGTRTLSLAVGNDGIFYAYNQIRTPIIYDHNDTNYFVDPSSTSRVNTISFVSGATFGPYLQYSNQSNMRLQAGAGSEIGITGYDFNGNWCFQIYGQSGAYGFLNGNWAGWDIKKIPNGNLYLNNGSTYYIGGSEIYYNRVYGTTDIRSPIFYDNNDTGYYTDPASTSTLYQLDVIRPIGTADDIRTGLRMYDSTAMAADVGGQLVLGYKYTSGGSYTEGAIIKTYKINATDGNYGSGLKFQVRNHGENLTTKMRLDGSGNLLLNGKLLNNGSVADDDYFGIYWDSGESSAYAIYRQGGAWTSPYPDLRIAFHTGISIGANASYNGIRFFNDYDMSSQVMSVNNSSDGLGANNVYVNNSLQAGSSLRAPMFYDSNNTSYYTDQASTSVYNNVQITTLGVGTAASGTGGEIRATNNITAYYSDERLKTKLGPIENPIEKVKALSGFYFSPNDTAMALGYKKTIDVGVSAQQVKEVLPEIIAPAPIDPQYMTVRYEKMIPLLIEAIKEQQKQIETLTERLSALEKTK